MPECDISISEWSSPVVVGPGDPIPTPHAVAPVCAGASQVLLADLLPGSRFTLTLGSGAELGVGEAYASTQIVSVPSLPAADTVRVSQELCDTFGPNSATPITGTVENYGTLRIREPVHACATAVVVEGGLAGAFLQVLDVASAAPNSGFIHKNASAALVPVAPAPREGQELLVTARACAGTEESPPALVDVVEEVPTPAIQTPLYERADALFVENLLMGAIVDVFRGGDWLLRFHALYEPSQSVPLPGQPARARCTRHSGRCVRSPRHYRPQ